MPVIRNVEELRADLERRVAAFMPEARELLQPKGDGLDQHMAVLRRFRGRSYELLNQLQHEFLIIRALEWLASQPTLDRVTHWHWHPASTGTAEEPDLLGLNEKEILVSAEITTSAQPVGVIDTRMRDTLNKLARMSGELFYFVESAEMAKRAMTKVRKAIHPITVVHLKS